MSDRHNLARNFKFTDDPPQIPAGRREKGDTYHLHVQRVAMILEGTALEQVPRDDNVHGAADLEYSPISYRSGHCLWGLLKKLSEKPTRVW